MEGATLQLYTLLTRPCRAIGLFAFAVTLLQVVGVKSNADGDALTSLRNSLSDPNHVLASWDPTLVDPCTWFHITCDSNNRVQRLDLALTGLSGKLVPDLGSLDQLQYLNLNKNSLNGSIPAEIGKLKNIVAIDLYENSLSDTIPPFANLPSLSFLRLQNNRLSGEIPSELGSNPTLTVLNISNNNLCGSVPPQLSSIPYVDVSNNPGLGKPCP